MDTHSSHTLAAERREAILTLLRQQGAVQVTELADHFDVNASTIRRDLSLLAERDALRRVHGGAVPVEEAEDDLGADGPVAVETRIGRAAAGLVTEDDEALFLGAGSLPLAVAHALAERPSLTVITNGLAVAHWVVAHTDHTLIVVGGEVERDGLGLVGPMARAALEDLRADRVFLELDGVSAVEGVTVDSLSRAEITRALLEIGSQIVTLTLPERVGRVAAAFVAPASDIDVLVTAREASSAYLWDLSELGMRTILS
jgi:DeoR/GlpR family transcriptional regulator of sugar metabolism